MEYNSLDVNVDRITESRIKSDYELIESGARYQDGRLVITDTQYIALSSQSDDNPRNLGLLALHDPNLDELDKPVNNIIAASERRAEASNIFNDKVSPYYDLFKSVFSFSQQQGKFTKKPTLKFHTTTRTLENFDVRYDFRAISGSHSGNRLLMTISDSESPQPKIRLKRTGFEYLSWGDLHEGQRALELVIGDGGISKLILTKLHNRSEFERTISDCNVNGSPLTELESFAPFDYQLVFTNSEKAGPGLVISNLYHPGYQYIVQKEAEYRFDPQANVLKLFGNQVVHNGLWAEKKDYKRPIDLPLEEYYSFLDSCLGLIPVAKNTQYN